MKFDSTEVWFTFRLALLLVFLAFCMRGCAHFIYTINGIH